MAPSTALRRAIRRIAEALTRYAQERGWPSEDYRIYYRANPAWDVVHVIFVARAFDAQDEYRNYVSVMEYLTQALAGEPGLLRMLGLVVRGSLQVEQGGIYSIGTDYREYWTLARR